MTWRFFKTSAHFANRFSTHKKPGPSRAKAMGKQRAGCVSITHLAKISGLFQVCADVVQIQGIFVR